MKVSQSCLFQASSSVFINRRFSSTVRPTPHKLYVTSTDRILKRKPFDEILRSGLGKSDIRPFQRNGSNGVCRTEDEIFVHCVSGVLSGSNVIVVLLTI